MLGTSSSIGWNFELDGIDHDPVLWELYIGTGQQPHFPSLEYGMSVKH